MKLVTPANFIKIIVLFFYSTFLFSQNIDSLKNALKLAKHDTTRCAILFALIESENDDNIWPAYNDELFKISSRNVNSFKTQTSKNKLKNLFLKHLADSYTNKGYFASNIKGDYKTAFIFYDKSLKLQELVNDSIGMATTLNNIGLLNQEQGDIAKAVYYSNKSLKLNILLKNNIGVARCLNNIALIYDDQGDIPKALNYYHKSLAIREKIQDYVGIAACLNNLGTIYQQQNDLFKALEYYQKSLIYQVKTDEKYGIANSLSNIGTIYVSQSKITKNNYIKDSLIDLAFKNYHKSLSIQIEMDNKKGMADIYSNIASYYLYKSGSLIPKAKRNTKDSLINKALFFYSNCLKIREEINDKKGTSNTLFNIANLLNLKGDLSAAKIKAETSMRLAEELGYPILIMNSSLLLSDLNSKLGNYKEAYTLHLLHKMMFDSVKSENAKKSTVQKQFQYTYEKKAAADSVRVSEEKKVFNAQIKQEKTQKIALFAGLGLIALFSIFMYNRFRITNRQKNIIEIQKIEVDKQRSIADDRRVLAENQKHIIEEKQKEILDSIHYAKRIQQAMLTSEDYFNQHFKADYFIFYKPKDIVSGDFYWAVNHNNKFYIATADCTGHGVPGAFMSLLNISFLNENVIENNHIEPAKILNEQRKKIIKALNPKGDENSKDGMDCILCAYDLDTLKLDFAAANNPLWLIRKKELIEYKADKMPVGKYDENANDFTNQQIDLQKGDVVYSFTDGFADQFGGPKNKKFLYKKFAQLLIDNHQLPMSEQKELLLSTITAWMTDTEQVDDILVIGVKI